MNMIVLAVVVLFPALLGLLAASYLKSPLSRMLAHECGTDERADFWVRVTTIGMMAGPTALALLRASWWDAGIAPEEIARMLISTSLNGMLAVLVGLACAIWLKIPARAKASGSAS